MSDRSSQHPNHRHKNNNPNSRHLPETKENTLSRVHTSHTTRQYPQSDHTNNNGSNNPTTRPYKPPTTYREYPTAPQNVQNPVISHVNGPKSSRDGLRGGIFDENDDSHEDDSNTYYPTNTRPSHNVHTQSQFKQPAFAGLKPIQAPLNHNPHSNPTPVNPLSRAHTSHTSRYNHNEHNNDSRSQHPFKSPSTSHYNNSYRHETHDLDPDLDEFQSDLQYVSTQPPQQVQPGFGYNAIKKNRFNDKDTLNMADLQTLQQKIYEKLIKINPNHDVLTIPKKAVIMEVLEFQYPHLIDDKLLDQYCEQLITCYTNQIQYYQQQQDFIAKEKEKIKQKDLINMQKAKQQLVNRVNKQQNAENINPAHNNTTTSDTNASTASDLVELKDALLQANVSTLRGGKVLSYEELKKNTFVSGGILGGDNPTQSTEIKLTNTLAKKSRWDDDDDDGDSDSDDALVTSNNHPAPSLPTQPSTHLQPPHPFNNIQQPIPQQHQQLPPQMQQQQQQQWSANTPSTLNSAAMIMMQTMMQNMLNQNRSIQPPQSENPNGSAPLDLKQPQSTPTTKLPLNPIYQSAPVQPPSIDFKSASVQKSVIHTTLTRPKPKQLYDFHNDPEHIHNHVDFNSTVNRSDNITSKLSTDAIKDRLNHYNTPSIVKIQQDRRQLDMVWFNNKNIITSIPNHINNPSNTNGCNLHELLEIVQHPDVTNIKYIQAPSIVINSIDQFTPPQLKQLLLEHHQTSYISPVLNQYQMNLYQTKEYLNDLNSSSTATTISSQSSLAVAMHAAMKRKLRKQKKRQRQNGGRIDHYEREYSFGDDLSSCTSNKTIKLEFYVNYDTVVHNNDLFNTDDYDDKNTNNNDDGNDVVDNTMLDDAVLQQAATLDTTQQTFSNSTPTIPTTSEITDTIVTKITPTTSTSLHKFEKTVLNRQHARFDNLLLKFPHSSLYLYFKQFPHLHNAYTVYKNTMGNVSLPLLHQEKKKRVKKNKNKNTVVSSQIDMSQDITISSLSPCDELDIIDKYIIQYYHRVKKTPFLLLPNTPYTQISYPDHILDMRIIDTIAQNIVNHQIQNTSSMTSYLYETMLTKRMYAEYLKLEKITKEEHYKKSVDMEYDLVIQAYTVQPNTDGTIESRLPEFLKNKDDYKLILLHFNTNNLIYLQYGFLFDVAHPNRLYYQWRLYSLMQGDGLYNYPLTPFQIVQNGPIIIPPAPFKQPTI